MRSSPGWALMAMLLVCAVARAQSPPAVTAITYTLAPPVTYATGALIYLFLLRTCARFGGLFLYHFYNLVVFIQVGVYQ